MKKHFGTNLTGFCIEFHANNIIVLINALAHLAVYLIMRKLINEYLPLVFSSQADVFVLSWARLEVPKHYIIRPFFLYNIVE